MIFGLSLPTLSYRDLYSVNLLSHLSILWFYFNTCLLALTSQTGSWFHWFLILHFLSYFCCHTITTILAHLVQHILIARIYNYNYSNFIFPIFFSLIYRNTSTSMGTIMEIRSAGPLMQSLPLQLGVFSLNVFSLLMFINCILSIFNVAKRDIT